MKQAWPLFTGITTLLWGVWGVFLDWPARYGISASLSYIVWALTMVPPAIMALKIAHWELDRDLWSGAWGLLAGLTGGGGILLLAKADAVGPAYIIFPLASLAPAVTILMAVVFLKEAATRLVWLGIGLAIVSVVLLSIRADDQQTTSGFLWLALTILVVFFWGANAFFVKLATGTASAESILAYMTMGSLVLVPFAAWEMGAVPDGASVSAILLTASIQLLNALGVWSSIYAYRYGKAIVVSPCVNALYPVITVALSLMLKGDIPPWYVDLGIVLCLSSVFLMVVGDATPDLHDERASAHLPPPLP